MGVEIYNHTYIFNSDTVSYIVNNDKHGWGGGGGGGDAYSDSAKKCCTNSSSYSGCTVWFQPLLL